MNKKIIMLLIDCSGSMEGAKIFSLKSAYTSFIKNLYAWFIKRQDKISVDLGVITFSDVANIACPIQPIEDLASSFNCNFIIAGGGTDFTPALTLCDSTLKQYTETLNQKDRYQVITILISDGYPKLGFEIILNKLIGTPMWMNMARFSIGIGIDVDKNALSNFTNHPIGPIMSVNAGAIPDSFDLISDLILNSKRQRGIDRDESKTHHTSRLSMAKQRLNSK